MEPVTPSRRLGAERAHRSLSRDGPLSRQVSVARGRLFQTWLRRAFAGAFLLGVASCAGAVLATPALLVGWLAAMFCMLGSAMMLSFSPAAKWHAGTVLAAPTGGLSILGPKSVHVRLEDVAAAWIEDERVVQVETHKGMVVGVRCASSEEAKGVLAALGVVRPRAVFRVGLSSAAERTALGRVSAIAGIVATSLAAFFVFLALVLGLGGLRGGADFGDVFATIFFSGLFALFVALLRYLLRSLTRHDVIVGADGFALPHDDVYVPYREIAHHKVHGRGVSVVRKDGTQIDLLTWHRGEAALDDAPPSMTPGALAQRTLATKIAEGVAAAKSPATSEALAVLERAGRTPEDWKAALEALPRAGMTYRVAGVDDDPLAQAIADAAAPLERRVAAAVALHKRAPDAARNAVRVAVDATAHEETARALARAAEGELDDDWMAQELQRAKLRR